MDVERNDLQLAGRPDGGRCISVRWPARQPVVDGHVGKAADADRGIGARDQEGTRETAAVHRDADRARLTGPHQPGCRLSELVDPALKELLIVA
jgi:hypothetical protein